MNEQTAKHLQKVDQSILDAYNALCTLKYENRGTPYETLFAEYADDLMNALKNRINGMYEILK